MLAIDVGQELKKIRLDKKYTQEEIAEILNRDVTGISKIENGKRGIEADVFLSWLGKCSNGLVTLEFGGNKVKIHIV